MKKVYIFDLDGTLLDSLNAWDNIGNKYLKTINVQGSNDLDEQVSNMTIEEAAHYMKVHFDLKQNIDEIKEGVCTQIKEQYMYHILLKPGVQTFLEKCLKQHIKMYIFTASDLLLAKLALKRLKIDQYFQAIYSCDDYGYTKNQPESYLHLIDGIGYKINECIVVEDALYAIQSAKQAGLYVKAIYDKNNDNDWLKICQIANQNYISFDEMEV